MRYKLSLGGRELKSVISVSETAANAIEEYQTLDGNCFCELTAAPLRGWNIELMLDCTNSATGKDDDELLDWLRELHGSEKALRLCVSCEVGSFAVRALLREMRVSNEYGDSCLVTLGLIEYKKAKARLTDAARVGTIRDADSTVSVSAAYTLLVQYAAAGQELKVVNPVTGAEVKNMAAVKDNTVLKVEKSDGKSAALEFEEKKKQIMGDAYGGYSMPGSSE